jgi:hypothetical protein
MSSLICFGPCDLFFFSTVSFRPTVPHVFDSPLEYKCYGVSQHRLPRPITTMDPLFLRLKHLTRYKPRKSWNLMVMPNPSSSPGGKLVRISVAMVRKYNSHFFHNLNSTHHLRRRNVFSSYGSKEISISSERLSLTGICGDLLHILYGKEITNICRCSVASNRISKARKSGRSFGGSILVSSFILPDDDHCFYSVSQAPSGYESCKKMM